MARPRRSTNTVNVKAAVRERDGFRCTGCGISNQDYKAKTGRQLDVHRVQPGSEYTVEPGVCVTMCKVCHGTQPRRKRGERALDVLNFSPLTCVRLRAVASHLGIDLANLLRLIVAENLKRYEQEQREQ